MTMLALFAVMSLPTVKQTVEVDCPNAASAAAATAEVSMLGEGEQFAFSGRWDDRNPRSLAVAKALSPLGFHSTFYTSGKSSEKYTPILREHVALGNSIGCHTISHGFMCRFLPTKNFREILENRIELEVDSQSPVVTLALPFGMHATTSPVIGFDNAKVIGTAASNAGLLGGAQKPDNSAECFGLSDDDWVGIYKFGANDKKPNEKTFWSGFRTGTNLVARGELPGGPCVTLGTHPWQKDEGLVKLAAMVKEAMATPGAVMMHANDYVAARLQFRRATVRKTGTKGNKAIFEIERPHPAVLGAAVPLNLKLSDGRFLKVAPPKDAAVPTVFERIDGALAVSDDDATFTLDFTNTTGQHLKDVSCALRLPPGYAPGIVRKNIPSLESGKSIRLVFTSAVPKDPLFREGMLFAAVEINAPGRRIWAPVAKNRGMCVKGPRDTALIRGFIPVAEVPSVKAIADLSAPNAKLGDEWRPADGSADGEAPWAIAGFRKDDRKKIHKLLPYSPPPQGTGFASMLVFDFEADTAAHGEEWNCIYGGGQIKKERVRAWLNGEARGFPDGKMKLRSGKNRLVILTTGLGYKMLFPMIAIRSAKDGTPVRWTK